MRKQLTMIMALILALVMATGCGSDASEPTTEAAKETTTEAAAEPAAEPAAAAEVPSAEQPLALTSAGQSADVKMIESLVKKTEMPYTIDTVMPADALGDAKTLIVAIGGSSKGLGAAGINAEDEIARVEEVIAKAKADGLTVIGMHVGGEGRRGELSDKFIHAAVPAVDYLVFVESGNADGLLTDLAASNGIPTASVDSIAGSLAALQEAFK